MADLQSEVAKNAVDLLTLFLLIQSSVTSFFRNKKQKPYDISCNTV